MDMPSKHMKNLRLILIVLILCCSMPEMIVAAESSRNSHQVESKWIQAIKDRSSDVQSMAGVGELDGFISYDQFWRLYSLLEDAYPGYVSKTQVIGKTYNDENILAFFIGNKESEEDRKDIVMFDALHHAREFVTLTMIVKIMEYTVGSLVRQQSEVLEFFKNNRILIVPIVNVDSFKLMSKEYGTKNWDLVQQIRKNQHLGNAKCDNNKFSGVDINRNYGEHFGYGSTPQGSSNDVCDEEYRGTEAFSEPETRAMRYVIEKYDRIVSVMNFHAFGDLWIYPANFQRSGLHNILRKLNHQLWKKYKIFEKIAPLSKQEKYGNAMKTIHYTAQGEASDWMALSKGLFAFSPELGTGDEESKTFYPKSEVQKDIIHQNFKIVQAFLKFHVPKLKIYHRGTNSVTVGLSSVFPLEDLQIHFDDEIPRDVLLNGQSVKDTLDELGLQFGDRLKFVFVDQHIISPRFGQNWRKPTSRSHILRKFTLRMGRRASKTDAQGMLVTQFDIFDSLTTKV
jgi:Zinc carboxypeptidase